MNMQSISMQSMNMLRTLAKQNMRYYRKRNILIGVAVFLTSFLVFVMLAAGVVFQQEQYASINAFYPNWHGQYNYITQDLADQIVSGENIEKYGIFSEMGVTELSKKSKISYRYADEKAMDMLRLELSKGRMPEKGNEIVLDPGAVEKLGKSVQLGGKVTLPYQIYRDGAKDYTEEQEFTVTGFLNNMDAEGKETYIALVSKELLEKEVPAGQVFYNFLFRIPDKDIESTDNTKNIIKSIASKYGIPENNTRINTYNLAASYADPDMYMLIFIVICVVVLAGIITIYSIYYIGTNERIQEYGRLKAAGMTSKELKKIVLWEGTGIVKRSAPPGIIAGMVLEAASIVVLHSVAWYSMDDIMPYLSIPKLVIYHLGIMVLAFFITYFTMYISLRKPMRTVKRITEIEAVRYPSSGNTGKSFKKKSANKISIFYLVKNTLGNNRKRSMATILAMSATGLLVMVVATVISCTDSRLDADDMCHGQYMFREMVEFDNKDHPEREWQEVMAANPLTGNLLKKIKKMDGVEKVTRFESIYAYIDELSWKYEIMGVPEENKSFIMDNIIEGNVTYEELQSGNKVVADKRSAKWYMDGIGIGDKITYTTEIGGKTIKKEAEIAAIGDFPIIFSGFYMASKSFDNISKKNLNAVFSVWAKEDYNEELYEKLARIEEEEPLLLLLTWQEEYELSQSGTLMVTVFCSVFLGILGCICAMNIVNTMVSSVQRRKKEIGMLQAAGMTDRQLFTMLQLEGAYYILGTLFVTIAGGALLSYPVYIWAEDHGILGVHKYQFPFSALIIISCVLAVLEIILVAFIAHSIKKETIIDRIRFSE